MKNIKRLSLENWRRKKIRTLNRVLRGELPLSSVMRNKWQKIKRFTALNSIVDVDLSKLLIGQQCGIPLKEWVNKTKDYGRVSKLLSDSPYVDFLKAVDNDKRIVTDKAMLRKTSYFQMSQISIDTFSSYMGKQSGEEIMGWMKVFYTLYTAAKRGEQYLPNEVMEQGHSGKDEPIQVFALRSSKYYEIIDGHHRCAIASMCGKDTVKVEVTADRYSYLQQLIRDSNGGAEHLLQPLDAPEVSHWPVVAGSAEKIELMLAFLRGENVRFENLSFCDTSCGYGYFMDRIKGLGGDVFGVEASAAALKIARIKYSIAESECCLDEPKSFLRRSDRRFEVVLCHWSERLEGDGLSDMICNLGRVTNKYLFVDVGERAALQGDMVERVKASNCFCDIQPLAGSLIVCVKGDSSHG